MLNRKGHGRFTAESAGTQPASEVNPNAIAALERHSFFWTGGHPKNVDGMLDRDWDFVITVCDRAKEACPVVPGQPVIAHWGMPDPAALVGTATEIQRAFDDAILLIGRRLDLFLALPIEKLSKLALQHRVRAIGQTGAFEPTSRET